MFSLISVYLIQTITITNSEYASIFTHKENRPQKNREKTSKRADNVTHLWFTL